MLLLLQRAAETVSGDDECNDPAVLLACALGSTGCPAKCTDEAQKAKEDGKNPYEGVQAGDLNIAVSSSSSTVSIPNDGVIKVGELAIKASENIQLQSLKVTREWLSTNDKIKVWVEKDGRRITTSSTFFGDSKAELTFNNNGYVVKGDETLDLVVSLDSYPQGSELKFKVSNVVSSAKNTTVSPDETGTFRTTQYTTTSISFVDITNNNRSYNLANDSSFSFGEFKLQNDSPASMEKDVMIKSITFKVNGSVENLANFKLLRDGKEVSNKYTVDGKSVTFAVNDQLDSGKSGTYKITAVPTAVENDADKWDDYTFSIKNAQDIIAEEIGDSATAYRVAVKGTMPDLKTTTIKGGNITLTRDSKLASTVSADWWYSDVVAAKGTIKVNQAVKFEWGIKVLAKDELAITKMDKAVRRAALVIDGRTYQANTIAETGFTFASEIYLAKGDHDIELQISLAGSKPAGFVADKLQFNALSASSFIDGSYQNSDETPFVANKQIVGTIKVADVKIESKVFTLKKTWPSQDVKFSYGNTDEVLVLVGEINNAENNTLEVNKIVVKPIDVNGWVCVWALDNNGDPSAAADVDTKSKCETVAAPKVATAWVWTLPADKKLWDLSVVFDNGSTSNNVAVNADDTKVSIDSITTSIDSGKSARFELRFVPSAGLLANDTFRFEVSVEGKLNGNNTTSSSINSAKITATPGATSSIVASTAENKQIIRPGATDARIAAFTYNVKNDSVDINKIVLKTNIKQADLDDLTIDFGDTTVWAPWLKFEDSATNWYLVAKFNNVVTLPVGSYKVLVKATFNENAIAKYKNLADAKADANGAKTIESVAFDPATDNATASDKWYAKLWYTHYVAKAYPILSVYGTPNTTKDNERLDIGFLASNSDNTVTITNIGSNPTANFNEADNVLRWRVVDGADANITKIDLDSSKQTVLRITNATSTLGTGAPAKFAWASISSVSFVVQDDDGNYAYYEDVNAWSDFASLSL